MLYHNTKINYIVYISYFEMQKSVLEPKKNHNYSSVFHMQRTTRSMI